MLDVRLLEHLKGPNVEVRSLNLATEQPPAAFNLVHTRLVLIHVPDASGRCVTWVSAVRVRAGSCCGQGSQEHVSDRGHRHRRLPAWDAFVAMTVKSGVDPHWARGLPERLGDLGLVDVGAEVDDQSIPGGSVPAQFWSLTWVQARERIGAVVDGGRAELSRTPRR